MKRREKWLSLMVACLVLLSACGAGVSAPTGSADTVVTVKEKPPELAELLSWDALGKEDTILPVMSGGKANERDLVYFAQSMGGYLYNRVDLPLSAEDKHKLQMGAQNIYPRNELQRIPEQGQVHFGDPQAVFLLAVNPQWRIGYFGVSDHYIWWTELNDQAEPQGWRLYERPLDGGEAKCLAEDMNVDSLRSKMPDHMSVDNDRLLVQVYDKESNGDVILYRDPRQDLLEKCAVLPDNKEDLRYFYDPQLQGKYAVWAEAKIVSDEKEESKIVLYDLDKKIWDFRITKQSAIYQGGPKPDTLLAPSVGGDYLIWRTEPEIKQPFLVDMTRLCAYPIPMNEKERMAYMTLTSDALYWREAGDNKDLHKVILAEKAQQ